MLRLDATFTLERPPPRKLEPDPDAGESQKVHRQAWLGE
jgi:hypothetical protein